MSRRRQTTELGTLKLELNAARAPIWATRPDVPIQLAPRWEPVRVTCIGGRGPGMTVWHTSWDVNPPQPGDPDHAAYIEAIPAERARLAALVDEAEAAPPLWDGYPDARDLDGFEVDPGPLEEQSTALDESAMDTPSISRATVQPPPLASTDRILDAVAATVARMGLAGESRAVKLVYLVVTTRLLDRIVSLAVKGPSAAGKSYIVEQVLRLFPDSAYHALSAMSEHALIYDDTDLVHRFLVIYEAAGLNGDITTYIVRSLLSEGRIRYATVEKAKGGTLLARTIDRPGPTGLLTTTTEIRLHPENETRLLSLTISDSSEQTKAILLAHARGVRDPVDLAPWHRLQEWLAAGPRDVTVPYLETLAGNIPPVAVRLRRDFPAVATLIRAHALLHRANRATDDHGATVEDYRVVRELVADLVADAAERSVPATVRDTIATVATLSIQGGDTTILAVAGALGIDKSAASRRIRSATDRGYIKNMEDKRGRPARLVLGDRLPEEQTVLPEPAELERLHGCSASRGDTPEDGARSASRAASEAPSAPEEVAGADGRGDADPTLGHTPSETGATVQPPADHLPDLTAIARASFAGVLVGDHLPPPPDDDRGALAEQSEMRP